VGVGRRSCVVVAVAAAVLAPAAPAWAHGQLRPGRAAAGATVKAVLAVPSERNGRGNSAIALALPPGFVPVSCGAPNGWRCSTADKGFMWERVSGGADSERFDLTVRVAPTTGTYVLPLSQTYDDGQVRTFAGGPGRPDEGPLFTLTAGGGATTPTAAAPGPTSVPDAGLTSLPAGRRLEPASSGGAPIALVAVGFVALTVLGGVVLLARQRRSEPTATTPADDR
jgi:uncharacterized protein YcnI